MDRLTVAAGLLFLVADVFAVASLLNPDWIRTAEPPAVQTLGLVLQCEQLHGRERSCSAPSQLPAPWKATLAFLACGVLALSAACVSIGVARWRPGAVVYSRWLAFAAMIMMCLGALIFPAGFSAEALGGEAYKLPANAQATTAWAVPVPFSAQLTRCRVCFFPLREPGRPAVVERRVAGGAATAF
ncbi:uncharacterized protein C16orf52 homolog B-like isoform X1 [Lampetra planeri]